MKTLNFRYIQRIGFIILSFSLILSCSGTVENSTIQDIPSYDIQGEINGADIITGHGIIESGYLLINRPNGLWKVVSDSTAKPQETVVVIHGYKSTGTEWVDAVKHLSQKYGSIYFYRWDWDTCPQEASKTFSMALNTLSATLPAGSKLTIFSHSYAGVIAMHAASRLSFKIPTDIHLIAASLLGHPRLDALCVEGQNNFTYTDWASNIQIKQWKTIQAQDGAFRNLAHDPQDLRNERIEVFSLPETMDGHRLGHNWSVLWVVDRYIGYPHDF